MVAGQQREHRDYESQVWNQKNASCIKYAGLGQGGGREAKRVVVILIGIAQNPLHAEGKRRQKERHQRLPAPLAEPDLERHEHHRQHDRQFLRFVSQPESREAQHPALAGVAPQAQQAEGGAEHVEDVHRLPEIVEQRHVQSEKQACRGGREPRGPEPPRHQPQQPHVEQVEGVQHRHIHREIQPRKFLHRVEIVVAHRTEIICLKPRRGGALQEIQRPEIRRPAQVIDLVVLKIAAIGVAVHRQEQRRERREEYQPRPLGHRTTIVAQWHAAQWQKDEAGAAACRVRPRAGRLLSAAPAKGIAFSRHFPRGGHPMRLLLLATLALPAFAATDSVAPGSLTTPKGLCPLRHTDVQVRIAGPLARVTVTQEFHNPYAEKIEAVYTFPLPPDSAVDDMTMHVGDRTIRGLIKPRDEARKIYEEARRTGRIAGLLDQERPNIFTQAVANILPGATVQIQIAYVETVPYEAGAYTFNFPMVVAPRYMARRGVPDAGRIAPPVTPEGTRAGHDIAVEVHLDAGVPIESLESRTHDVSIERPNPRQAVIKLRDQTAIPNKDFILKYGVASHRVEDAVLRSEER